MPNKPPSVCSNPMCNEYATLKGRCSNHQVKQVRSYKPRTDSFYSGSGWRKTRLAILFAEPLCRHCKGVGVLTEATVVDHVIRLTHYQYGTHNKDNLQSLCVECHNIKTQREQKFYDDGTWNDPSMNPYIVGDK